MRPAAWECERLRLARCGPISVYLYVLEVGRGTPLPEFLRIRFAIFNRGGGEDEGSKTIQTRPIIVIRLVVLIGCRSGWHAMHRHLATTICATPTRRFFVARDPAASGTMLIGRSRLASRLDRHRRARSQAEGFQPTALLRFRQAPAESVERAGIAAVAFNQECPSASQA